jgi:Rad3-related DNA helicase
VFERLDNSGRPPWKHQTDILKWLEENWDRYSVFGLNLATGSGKQFIARAIQVQFGGAYVTPNNLLIAQAAGQYPDVNVLMGRARYECQHNPGRSCEEMNELPGHGACRDCQYKQAKARAIRQEDTFYNPYSFFFLAQQPGFKYPNVTVVDEAHKLAPMLLDLGTVDLAKSRYRSPDSTNLVDVVAWLTKTKKALDRVTNERLRRNHLDEALQASGKASKIGRILESIEAEPQCFHIYEERRQLKKKTETYVVIKPLYVPTKTLRQVLTCNKLILMSATLPRPDVEALSLGRAIGYLDVPSPIPADQRPVRYRPAPVPMNYQTNVEDIAAWIRKHLQPVNTIVHVTYDLSKRLAPLFPGCLTNTPETKNKVLAKFKESRGALWLASGCAEGVDLPGDECRLNLIPILFRANIKDPWVKKRMTIEGGGQWYDLEVLKTTMQQVGRSTRGLGDWSVTVIGDQAFPRLLKQYAEHVPVSFREAIDWRVSEKATESFDYFRSAAKTGSDP